MATELCARIAGITDRISLLRMRMRRMGYIILDFPARRGYELDKEFEGVKRACQESGSP